MQNISYKDEFDVYEKKNLEVELIFIQMVWARRLVFKQRQNSAGKWPIIISGVLTISARVQMLYDCRY